MAAASSSSQQRAQDFLKDIDAPPSARPYGSYAALLQDDELDIVYVATPHSHHFQHSMACLEAGKNVLCEKPITVNAAQLEALMAAATRKRLFLMEAAWTRYMPAARYVQESIATGRIGAISRVFADFSTRVPLDEMSDSNRLLDPSLAGGVLLDIGVYALTWVFVALYQSAQHNSDEKGSAPRLVSSAVERHSTGVDVQTSLIIQFPRKNNVAAHAVAAHAVVTTSMMVSTEPKNTGNWPAVRIQGSDGEIQVMHPIFRPERTRIITSDGSTEDKEWEQPGPGKGSGWRNGFANELGGELHEEGVGHGMFWEADECAIALREGLTESRLHPLSESLALMRIIDEVRGEHKIKFPESVETAVFSETDARTQI